MDSIKVLITLLAYFLEVILGVIFFLLLLIIFDVKIVGYYGAILSFFMIIQFILKFGFGIAHIKFYSEAKSVDDKALCNGTFLLIRLIQYSIYIGIILVLIPITTIYKENIVVIYVLFFAEIFAITGYFFEPIFFSEKEVIKKSIPIILSSLIKIFLIIFFKNLFKNNIWFLIYILIIANFSYFALNLYFGKNIKLKKPIYQYIKKYFKFALPFFIITGLRTILNYIDVLLVNIWFPIENVANYYAAKQFYTYTAFFIFFISNILLSTFVKNITLDIEEKNLLIIRKIHKFMNLFIVPVVFVSIIYSPQIIILFFGKSYELTGTIFIIFILSLIPISLECAIPIHLRAKGKVNFLAQISALKFLIAITLLIIFITPYFLNLGAIGGALAFLFTEILTQLITRPIFYKKYSIGFYWGSFRNLVIMLGIFFLQLYINELIFYPLFFIPFFVIFDIIIYFFINYLLKGISKEDLKYLLSIISYKNIKDQIFDEFKNN